MTQGYGKVRRKTRSHKEKHEAKPLEEEGRQEEEKKTDKKKVCVQGARKTIMVLNEIPLVLSVFVFMNFALDIAGFSQPVVLAPLFGMSVYILARLYAASRKMFVSSWAKALYVTLIAVMTVETTDEILGLSERFVGIQEFLFSLFMIGILVSLFTFIYDKYKYKF